MNLHFYQCSICGKVIVVLSANDNPTECCGQPMQELVPNRTDASAEKHVPVFSEKDNTVKVQIGSVPHPMTDDHCIKWVGLSTAHDFCIHELHPGECAEACFCTSPECRPETIYSYCNMHGLWCCDAKNEKACDKTTDKMCGKKIDKMSEKEAE